ncbi:MAG: regulatory iron-sulfur-containing complex subunit RicT [Phycisphaerales bacterium]|nr:regulatory iron-sulfur-containing complex subunit RicT [Phycisphaerales bacterium]
MPIHPLPQFEADLEEYLKEKADREAYEKLSAPSTIVVRFGYLRMVGEFPYSGDAKPGCGSKLVVKTHRGVEIGEMLTSTCKNSGCSKSVSRKEMLEYIENSGGRQYPFYDQGRVLRIATTHDLNDQTKLEQKKNELRMIAKRRVEQAGLEMQIIEAESILGNERVVFYFSAEDRVDFRELVQDLQKEIGTKVELRQIGARDEARITADYERCGQYCCCKNFLKVLKPVSMKSAKIQKATLDPLKISGRCGRLMCCLRYEDETYDELRKNLPNRKSRVGTPDGDGMVLSTQILTQLALIKLDSGTEVAIAVEELTEPESKTAPEPGSRMMKPRKGSGSRSGTGDRGSGKSSKSSSKKRKRSGQSSKDTQAKDATTTDASVGESSTTSEPTKKRRRRRRRRSGASAEGGATPTNGSSNSGSAEASSNNPSAGKSAQSAGDQTKSSGNTSNSDTAGTGTGPKKKRRRKRRRRTSGEGPGSGSDSGSGNEPSGGSGNNES